jgi:flagellar hook-length control protein FliK
MTAMNVATSPSLSATAASAATGIGATAGPGGGDGGQPGNDQQFGQALAGQLGAQSVSTGPVNGPSSSGRVDGAATTSTGPTDPKAADDAAAELNGQLAALLMMANTPPPNAAPLTTANPSTANPSTANLAAASATAAPGTVDPLAEALTTALDPRAASASATTASAAETSAAGSSATGVASTTELAGRRPASSTIGDADATPGSNPPALTSLLAAFDTSPAGPASTVSGAAGPVTNPLTNSATGPVTGAIAGAGLDAAVVALEVAASKRPDKAGADGPPAAASAATGVGTTSAAFAAALASAPPTVAPAAPTTSAPASPASPLPTPAQTAEPIVTALAPLRSRPDGVHQISVALHPAELGVVHVVARLVNGSLQVDLTGVSDAARSALRDALPDLRADLLQAGFTGVGVDVGGQSRPDSGRDAPTPTESRAGDAVSPAPRAGPVTATRRAAAGRLDQLL